MRWYNTKFKMFLLIHGNLLGLMSGIEGYFISQGNIYAIPFGIALGIYGNLFGNKLSKIIKQMIAEWISSYIGESVGMNIKESILNKKI